MSGADLFGDGFRVEPVLREARLSYHGFFTYQQGQMELSVGRADLEQCIVISVCDPERGTTQLTIAARDLVQEALKVHRQRFAEESKVVAEPRRGRR